MRPLQLELEGFTSYREPTLVDFADTDLLAFTGATGSGKSSLIDAMIFALYGSVPRYGKLGLIAPVISQGKNQAKVRLDFEARGRTYRAVRVVELSGLGARTKEARLEELQDGQIFRTLAATGPDLSASVEKDVVGLTLDHFTKCVVLPQGEFAAFLQEKPAKRKEMLERLLGLGLWDRIREAAKDRWQDRESRAEYLKWQRESALAHATREAVSGAAARVGTLNHLQEYLKEVSTEIEKLNAAVQDADNRWTQAAERLEPLAEVCVPAGTVELTVRHRKAEEGFQTASHAMEAATARLLRAQSESAALPARAVIESVVEKREKLARWLAKIERSERELNDATEAAERARTREGSLQEELAEAETSLQQLPAKVDLEFVAEARGRLLDLERETAYNREKFREAERRLQDAAARKTELQTDLGRMEDRLKALPTGDKLDEVRQERSRLREREREAELTRQALGELEQRLQDSKGQEDVAVARLAQASDRLTNLPSRAELKGIRERWNELAQVEDAALGTRRDLALAGEKRTTAELGAASAEQRFEAAIEHWEMLRMANSATELARNLEEGQPCPVCHQTVGTLPLHDTPADLEAALKARNDARRARDDAQLVLQRRNSHRDQCVARLKQQQSSAYALRAALAGKPAEERISRLLAEIDETERRIPELEREAKERRRNRTQCELNQNSAAEALRQQEGFVRSLEEALAEKPTLDEIDAFRVELDDLEGRIGALESSLDDVEQEMADYGSRKTAAGAQLDEQERSVALLRADLRGKPTHNEIQTLLEDIAGLEEETRVRGERVGAATQERTERENVLSAARAALEQQKEVAGNLRVELASAASPEETARLLDAIAEAEDVLRQARAEDEAARRAKHDAEQEFDGWQSRVTGAWKRYGATRDSVAAMQPPRMAEGDLAGSWQALGKWAERTYTANEEALTRADAERTEASEEKIRLDSRVRERCQGDQLTVQAHEDPDRRLRKR